jgi:hypothetical protein
MMCRSQSRRKERTRRGAANRKPLVAFLEDMHLEGLDTERDADHGRDAEL